MARKDNKKYSVGRIGRVERETRYNNLVKYGTVIIIVLVVVLISTGIVLGGYIQPNQPIAVIEGEEIVTKEYQARIRFERQNLVSSYNQFASILQTPLDPFIQSQYQNYLSQIQLQLNPLNVGQAILDAMIEEILINKEAAARGISVSEEEIDIALEESFGYFSGGEPTSTSTTIPTTAPTSTLSLTQNALSTPEPTQTSTVTATLDPELTPEATAEDNEDGEETAFTPTPAFFVPTFTPAAMTLDEYETIYDDNIGFLNQELKLTEEYFRKLIGAQLLRFKLLDEITADVPREQEQVWARHILVADDAMANLVLSRLETGDDWTEMASQFSSDTSNSNSGGDLGWFSITTMVPEFANVAFSLEIGEISEPVESQFGWHIIQVLGHESRPLSSAAYENVRVEVFTDWLTELREASDIEILDYWINRIPDDPSVPQFRFGQ